MLKIFLLFYFTYFFFFLHFATNISYIRQECTKSKQTTNWSAISNKSLYLKKIFLKLILYKLFHCASFIILRKQRNDK